MQKVYHLDQLLENNAFRFDKLVIKNIDNSSVDEKSPQEDSLFHRDISCGDKYVEVVHDLIKQGMLSRSETPVVRFADGEYAFYENNLACNGLYKQAESVQAIKKALPAHINALKILAKTGKIAALIYPDKPEKERKRIFPFFRKPKEGFSSFKFVDFLFTHNIELSNENYIPFYTVYAYLTSIDFANLVNNKKVCIVSSECNKDACKRWFARFSSYPDIVFTEIPDSYVATRWESMKENVLSQVPSDVDLCLVGAGVGSVLVCIDMAIQFSIPAIDAGHILNMMNGREDKSNGPRLYTIRKNAKEEK